MENELNEDSKNVQDHEKKCKKDKCHENNNTCKNAELSKQLKDAENKVNDLEKKLKETENELNEIKVKASQYLNTASYYKTQAETNKKDFERYKERNKDIEVQAKTKANECVAKKILPILDNFDQAMLQVDLEVMKGFLMIYTSIQNVLTDIGVVEIVSKNEELNPNIHNCISTEPTDDESLDGHIATIYQKGYKFAETDEVIRPATVSVYKK